MAIGEPAISVPGEVAVSFLEGGDAVFRESAKVVPPEHLVEVGASVDDEDGRGAELLRLLLFADVCRQVAEHARVCDGEVGVTGIVEQYEPVTNSRALVQLRQIR